jgi:hypothetical protein
METALYFPYVRVPETPWFTQVLLYWDRAAAIVPSSLVRTGAVAQYMTELADHHLLEYIDPDHELSDQWDTFDRAFVELLESRTLPSDPLRFTKVHSGKLSFRLFNELRERGLAEHADGPGWESWWLVERGTAAAYMAYLASVISGARISTLPVTDQKQTIGSLGEDSPDLERQLASLRYAAVTSALPAPAEPVPAAELRAFKEANTDKLVRCRRFLDRRLADLASEADPYLRKVKADGVLQEIEDEVKTLEEGMRKRHWPRVTLIGIGGVMGAALAVASVAVTGGTALAVGLGVGAGVLQLGAATHAAAELINQPRFDPRAPLAYAALAAQL